MKFGKAFGLKVTVISTSPNKKSEATDKLGADSFIDSKDPEQMKAAMGTIDYIIDTISVDHPCCHSLDY
jgi:cinnamyl-alcohol dehydrogenase